MSSIPLPALALKPVEQPDVMGNVSKLTALKSMMTQQASQQQELQIRDQQIKDQQATTAAMKNWDGKDYDALSKSVLENGGSANAATAIQQHGLTIKKTVSDIAKQDAETGSKNLETFIGKHKAIGDTLEGIEQVPDNQIHAVAAQKVGELAKAGILDPQSAQQAMQGIQSTQDPVALRQQIDVFAKASMGAKAAAEQEKTKAETNKDTAQAEEATASAANKRAESKFYQENGGAPGVPAEMLQMSNALRQGKISNPSEWPAYKAKQDAIATAPEKIAVARAEGEARANIEAQVARGSNAAVAQVPPHLVAPAVSAATKAGEDFAQAQSVTQRLNAMMDSARKGNVVAYQVMPEEGTLQITTSQGVHRINQAEIQQYAGGGSLWQRLMGHIGKQLTGKSIPDSVLNDMADIQKIQSQGSQLKYNNSLKTINQTYGAKFEPVSMDDMKSVSDQPAATPSPGGFNWNNMPEHK
jgi:hypothetical protein